MAEKLTDNLVQIEHFQTEIAPYFRRKLKSPSMKREVYAKDRINTREYSSLTWEDLEKEDAELTKKIKELAASYNYTS